MNISHVSEIVIGSREAVMTDSGFSRISVSHGRLNCRQVIQYNIVNKVTEECIGAAVAKRKGTHLSLVI